MRTVTLYSVVYDVPQRSDGMTDDIARFRKETEAEDFAKGRTCYGRPATVSKETVPATIARRWGF